MAASKAQIGKESRRSLKSGRWYDIPPLYPSVTNIEGIIAKPALVNWSAKVERIATIQAAADMFEEWKDGLKITSTISRDVYCSLLESRIGKKKESQKQLEAAGEIGSQAHEMIEWHIASQLGLKPGLQPKICDKALWAFLGYETWAHQVDLVPIRSEQVVFSHRCGYAGTMDLLAYIGKERKIALIDFKTGKAIYVESFLQLAAYREALIEMGLETADECWILRLPKNELDPEFEARQVTDLDVHFKAFLAAKDLWQWHYNETKKDGDL